MSWNDFHEDPRISYYLYLRRGLQLPASEAHRRVKRMDALVVGLQGDRRARALHVPRVLARARARLRQLFTHAPEPSSRPQAWGRRWSDFDPTTR